METFSKSSLKKFLYLYLGAVIIVAVYFTAKLVFQEEKVIEHKRFKAPSETANVTQEDKQEKDEATKFILMPKH